MKKPATLATIAAVATLSVAASVPAHAAHEDIIVPLAVAGAIIYLSDNDRHDGHRNDRDRRHYNYHNNYKAKVNARRHYGYHRREEVRHDRWHARNDYRWGFPAYRAHEKYHATQKYAQRDRYRDHRRDDHRDKRH